MRIETKALRLPLVLLHSFENRVATEEILLLNIYLFINNAHAN